MQGKRRFSFLTGAKTMGTMGIGAGLAGIAAGFVAPGGGFALAAGALALAFIGYRQQKQQGETQPVVYTALLTGLAALAVSVVSAFVGR